MLIKNNNYMYITKMIFFTGRFMNRQVVFWHWEIAPQQTCSSVLITWIVISTLIITMDVTCQCKLKSEY